MGKTFVVVGGGLAGLASATYLSRAGRDVTVYEKARAVGGRAVTTSVGEFRWNLGPHALYVSGEGRAVLEDLGVAVRGGRPPASGSFAIRGGRLDTLPVGPMSLLTTGSCLSGARSRWPGSSPRCRRSTRGRSADGPRRSGSPTCRVGRRCGSCSPRSSGWRPTPTIPSVRGRRRRSRRSSAHSGRASCISMGDGNRSWTVCEHRPRRRACGSRRTCRSVASSSTGSSAACVSR